MSIRAAMLLRPIFVSLAMSAAVTVGDELVHRHDPDRKGGSLAQGIAWPAGQALPTFAPPAEQLDVIDVRSLTPDERITFSALQGLVNRVSPRILIADNRAEEGRDTWAATATMRLSLGEQYDYRNKFELIAKYADESTAAGERTIGGLVLYDITRSRHYRNLASTVAGIEGGLPCSIGVYNRLVQQGVEFPVLADLTKLEWTESRDIYQHLYDTYWPACERRLIVSARPDDRGGDHHHTRDLAAACGLAVVWLDCRDADERQLMRRFYADMPGGKSLVLGWHASERSGVTTASEFAIGTLPSDHYNSPSIFAACDHQIDIPPVPRKPPLANKAYIALFISDGDNIQYNQHAMRRVWDRTRATRGRVALNWTIAPALVDIGPGIMNYYYATATPNDCFVAGPSGMGYMMPVNTLAEPGARVGVHLDDEQCMESYAKRTQRYLECAGLRVVTIWDNATPSQRATYATHCRDLFGATVHNFRDDPTVASSVANNRVRFDKLEIPYCGSADHLAGSIRRNLSQWDRQSPLFLSYQVNIWGQLSPEQLVDLAEQIREELSAEVEFVRADHYFTLFNEANGLPWNLCLMPSVAVRSSADSEHAEMTIDGTPSTAWKPASAESTELEYDLAAPCQISRVVIRLADSVGTARVDNLRNITMESSLDRETWTPLKIVSEHGTAGGDYSVKPVSARWIRLLVGKGGDVEQLPIAEVEIYGTQRLVTEIE